MLIFAVTAFLSSFLLFAIQPMVAKFLLPSFGGTAGVWATCLVMYQLLLLGGYAYADGLRRLASPRVQRWTHLALLAVALAFLPPAPHATIIPGGIPTSELLQALVTAIGVPFFALSATAPLLMEWFRQCSPGRSPDRLYAFSNAGSLLALLAYPVLFEPVFTRNTQAWIWAGGMAVFLACFGVVAWTSWVEGTPPYERAGTGVGNPGPMPERQGLPSLFKASARAESLESSKWLWVALPACGSGLLLAVTNQISQDVAPMPLLWVAPMAVYLLTFIFCFEGRRQWYLRGLFVPAGFIAFLMLAWLLDQGYLRGFGVQVGGYLAVLFVGCMVCHGELYRLRPLPERLTSYYLAISLGGALGGILVGLVAPAVFNTLLETPLIAIAIAALCTFLLWREKTSKPAKRDVRRILALGSTLIITLALGYVVWDQRTESIFFTRSFYGAYRVKEGPTLLLNGTDYTLASGTARVLLSGQIYHGLQFTNPETAAVPTTYYCMEGGLGLAFREMTITSNRNIGAIGLGTGTLAAYGKTGDHIRFYELNPDVVRIAKTLFTFLSDCPAQVDVVLGDGRLSLAREPSQHFDLLVLDAFAGDSIPMHLLTSEAMRIYQRHLKADGVIAFHISNSHLDLEPVVRALANQCGMAAVLVPPKFMDPRQGKLASMWMLVSANREFLDRPGIGNLTSSMNDGRWPLLWTDDYSSILPILH